MTVRLLAYAYACEPGTGSEPGAGWIWSRMLSRLGDTWVITRANNRPQIEAALKNTAGSERLHFVYVDLPQWARFWKRGSRGIHLYYLLWQMAAIRAARRLHDEHHFDLVWHLTLSTVWLGSTASSLGVPMVFGPVGGGLKTPWRLLPAEGLKGALSEIKRSIVLWLARYANPMARMTWRRATLILVQNRETRAWLPRRYRSKAELFPNIVLDPLPQGRQRRADGTPTALFAGRLIPWKGLMLAVRAMTNLPEWRLLIVGAGPDRRRLVRAAREAGVADRVEIQPWLAREDLLRVLREEADVFLFPSTQDQAGWAPTEALAAGIPVVRLSNGAGELLGGRLVPPGRPSETAAAIARAIKDAAVGGAPPAGAFDLESRFAALIAVLERRLPKRADTRAPVAGSDRKAR